MTSGLPESILPPAFPPLKSIQKQPSENKRQPNISSSVLHRSTQKSSGRGLCHRVDHQSVDKGVPSLLKSLSRVKKAVCPPLKLTPPADTDELDCDSPPLPMHSKRKSPSSPSTVSSDQHIRHQLRPLEFGHNPTHSSSIPFLVGQTSTLPPTIVSSFTLPRRSQGAKSSCFPSQPVSVEPKKSSVFQDEQSEEVFIQKDLPSQSQMRLRPLSTSPLQINLNDAVEDGSDDLAPPSTPPPIRTKVLPDSAGFGTSTTSKALKCPDTPFVPIAHLEAPMPFRQNANAVSLAVLNNTMAGTPFTLEVGALQFQIQSAEYIGSGQYNDAYLVVTTTGKKMVLKILQEKIRNGWANSAIAAILKNEILVYLGFKSILENAVFAGRVAEFFDIEQYRGTPFHLITGPNQMRDWIKEHFTHGFHLVEYVEHEYPVDSLEGRLPRMLTENEAAADTQILHMFHEACSANIRDPEGQLLAVDLQKGNVRLDNLGIVVLVDPAMPDRDEDFRVNIKKNLVTFAPLDSPRYRFLYPSGIQD